MIYLIYFISYLLIGALFVGVLINFATKDDEYYGALLLGAFWPFGLALLIGLLIGEFFRKLSNF